MYIRYSVICCLQMTSFVTSGTHHTNSTFPSRPTTMASETTTCTTKTTATEPTTTLPSPTIPLVNHDDKSWLYMWLMYLNGLTIVPMYTMLLAMTCFLSLWYVAPSGSLLQMTVYIYIVFASLDPSPQSGGWKTTGWFWNKSLQRLCRDHVGIWFYGRYHDAKLIKEDNYDLPSAGHDGKKKNYIFAYHPHGIIGIGANLALNTNACDFEAIFPGVSTFAGRVACNCSCQ